VLGPLAELFSNVNTFAATAQEIYAEEPVPTIVLQINETDALSDSATRVQWLLREVKEPQTIDLESQFEQCGIQTQFPILRLFLEHRNKLNLLQHLLVIVSWTNTVREACSNQYSREEMLDTTVLEAIKECPGFYDACMRNFDSAFLVAERPSSRNRTKPQRSMVVKRCFTRFQRAWKALRESDFITQADEERDASIRLIFDECARVRVEDITDDSSLYTCTIETKYHGRILCRVIERLATIQNEFLQAVRTAAAAESEPVEKHVQHVNTNAVCVIQKCRGLCADWDAENANAQIDDQQDDLWELMKG
jgi:hypothetical protein